MNRIYLSRSCYRWCLAVIMFAMTVFTPVTNSQDFDFETLRQKAQKFMVIVDMKLEISFGIHTTDQQERYLGTVVSDDGLVLFDGTTLNENSFNSFSPFSIKVTPIKIEISSLEGKKFDAEYIGVDRFTQIGFVRILKYEKNDFQPVSFRSDKNFSVGEWLTLFMLMPEYINPPLAADVGMVSSVVTSPEFFPLTVGFNSLQMTSVIFDENLQPVGVLGRLLDPSQTSSESGSIMESLRQNNIPLLGVIIGDRLAKLIADPPVKGQPDRGWLGIAHQALTPDMARFWNLDISSGIIVNDIITNSPAQKAGLKVGDIIYEVNGQPVEIDKDEELSIFQRLIAELGPGTSVELSVMRRRDDAPARTLQLYATLEKAPLAAAEAPSYEVEDLEFEVRNLVFADYLFLNLDPELFTGVIVTDIKQGGLADIGGLRPGDIIQKVGNDPAQSIDEFSAIMETLAIQKPREVIFFVWRDNKTLFINIKTDW